MSSQNTNNKNSVFLKSSSRIYIRGKLWKEKHEAGENWKTGWFDGMGYKCFQPMSFPRPTQKLRSIIVTSFQGKCCTFIVRKT